MIDLIAERYSLVRQAAHHKKTEADVAAPKRVEQVIQRVRAYAEDRRVPADLVEAVYRTLIGQFIALERIEWAKEKKADGDVHE